MKYNINNVSQATGEFVTANSPMILLGTGITAGIFAVGAAAIGGYKARERVDQIRQNPRYDELDRKSMIMVYIKEVGPVFIPAALLTGAMIFTTCSCYKEQNKRLAAATAAAAFEAEAFRRYVASAKKIFGEDAEKEVRKEVKESMKDEVILETEKGNTIALPNAQLFRDSLTKQYFVSTKDDIQEQLMDFNMRIMIDGYMTLDDWCDYLGLDHVFNGNRMVWDEKNLPITIDYKAVIAPDGRSALEILYSSHPKDWMRH